jgi:hypothetical protein
MGAVLACQPAALVAFCDSRTDTRFPCHPRSLGVDHLFTIGTHHDRRFKLTDVNRFVSQPDPDSRPPKRLIVTLRVTSKGFFLDYDRAIIQR